MPAISTSINRDCSLEGHDPTESFSTPWVAAYWHFFRSQKAKADHTAVSFQVSDIDAPVPFTASPPTQSPNGQPGVATTFSTQDGSHVIKDTIAVLADPNAATDALNAAKAGQGAALTHPTTDAAKVGTNGTVLSGNSSDNSKGIAILLFTEGKAFVTLEFDGPADSLPPQDFVSDLGAKQDAAVKKGLGG